MCSIALLAEAQRFDHHQRGFSEVFGHGASSASLCSFTHALNHVQLSLTVLW